MSLKNTALDDQAVLCISRTLASAPSCAVLGRVFSLPDWLALGRTDMEEGIQGDGMRSSRTEERESVEYKCACVGCDGGRTFLIRSHPRRQLYDFLQNNENKAEMAPKQRSLHVRWSSECCWGHQPQHMFPSVGDQSRPERLLIDGYSHLHLLVPNEFAFSEQTIRLAGPAIDFQQIIQVH